MNLIRICGTHRDVCLVADKIVFFYRDDNALVVDCGQKEPLRIPVGSVVDAINAEAHLTEELRKLE